LFSITIEANEPLLIGGIQRAANYRESEEIVTGAVIKGVLAKTLNTLCGVNNPRSTPISGNSDVAKHYPCLAEHFSRIRFTHAFPTTGDRRPVGIPYSAVDEGGSSYDVALSKDIRPINGKAPVFQTDWKAYPDDFGWASPRRIVKTRTAIDEALRRAEENLMFTYQYVCPVDKEGEKIIWHGLIRLPEYNRDNLYAELLDAVPRIKRMGKRMSKIRVFIKPGKCDHAQTANGFPGADNTVIITLQSDAMMVNPEDIKNEQTANKLHELYAEYWKKISDSSMEMVRFFAHQRLLGGFLVRRHGEKYYPFYLTGAGSVFVLTVDNINAAANWVREWQSSGLPVPEWAKTRYQKPGKELWETCPFVPENGYGEVMVNLKWHFEKDIRNAGGQK